MGELYPHKMGGCRRNKFRGSISTYCKRSIPETMELARRVFAYHPSFLWGQNRQRRAFYLVGSGGLSRCHFGGVILRRDNVIAPDISVAIHASLHHSIAQDLQEEA
jgi:hypothetical protein